MTGPNVSRGDSPVVLGFPHDGIDLPEDILATLNETGRARADTDWQIFRLHDGLADGLTTVRTPIHRYAIDLNRDPSGQSLYPGQATTALCPITDFDGRPLYQPGQEPDDGEIARRRTAFHAPYHAALRAELDRVKAKHGFAILYDCHSIRSHIPRLFDGTLPDFNIGTNGTTTCAATLEDAVTGTCAAAAGFSHVVNGRFKGGWTTRHYGRPAEGIHAIQMELAQSAYLAAETPPWTYDAAKADRLRSHLRIILDTLTRWRPA